MQKDWVKTVEFIVDSESYICQRKFKYLYIIEKEFQFYELGRQLVLIVQR